MLVVPLKKEEVLDFVKNLFSAYSLPKVLVDYLDVDANYQLMEQLHFDFEIT
ncbi:unnamed protein product [Meloidogyne enterolobii]|uniref:Uncharacterized protein n=1 Tax=Meloidogyne enterolobii TaxID=390850 RepID=A0ACB1B4J6_MELEN